VVEIAKRLMNERRLAMTSIENQFVMVPVPAHRVQEVYALLGQPPSPTPTKPTRDDSGWTEVLLRRLYMDSADNAQHLLRYLAKADGEEVSTNEIAKELNLPKGAMSVAGMAGAIGRRVNSRYGLDGSPWHSRWRHIDPSDPEKGTETMLSLPKWMCDVINDL
jgi:hypothetical protein